jgi:integrase
VRATGALGADQAGLTYARVITDFRKALDAVAVRAGWKAGEVRSKMFRHTYTAARLQTLDGKAPVSVFTVANELGHGGEAMVRKVYGHLGQVRHRAPVVEYRVQQHRTKLGDRLRGLRAGAFGTTVGTTGLELPSDDVSRCGT